MSDGKMDDLKGRAKEAAGDLSGDKDLEREGRVDRVTGSVKRKISGIADKVKDTVNRDK
jgi:uncharacterized protein YjbJ (UPF0337 family)